KSDSCPSRGSPRRSPKRHFRATAAGFGKHQFIQPQLLAILCLMRYEDWTFRETEMQLHLETFVLLRVDGPACASCGPVPEPRAKKKQFFVSVFRNSAIRRIVSRPPID